jgi:hypothetical protein
VEQELVVSVGQCETVSGSTSQRARVVGQLPPKLQIVLRSVMYVPPTAGSLIFAKKLITDTNIE